MLDMGFIEDIETIVAALPAARQTLLFSATLDARIADMTTRLLREPLRIEVDRQSGHSESIEQRLLYADSVVHKTRLLETILRDGSMRQAIVFTATKRDADQIAGDLGATGFSAAALHGDMTQGQRNRTLTRLRRGALRVLVATDVAARGLDVHSISHVINFDMPRSAEDYVHRIGRTGRAGRAGVAISFAGVREKRQVNAIERYTRRRMTVHTIPGLEPKPEPRRSFGRDSDSAGRARSASRTNGPAGAGHGVKLGTRPARRGARG
jgi:superfamily II DNA/RNA helicase